MESNRARLGGVLTLVAGIVGLVSGLMFMLTGENIEIALTFPTTIAALNGLPTLILGIIGLAGGAVAMRKKAFGFAIAGAVLSIVATLNLGIVIILGILGVIFIAMGKSEFA
jgi:hypothetical protein